jgi:Ser/Thr protein kinase RdoA (MazF antagonist)
VKDGDEIWQLFEFIPGSYFKGTNKEMIAAGLVIANLHMALRKISPRGLPAMFPRITFKKWQIFLDRLNKEGFEIKDTQIGQALQKNESCLIEQKKVIIHSDLHPHNILSFSGEKLSIIDFGNLSIDDERLDLASAAHRLSRQFVVYNTKLDFRSQEELFVNGLKIFLTSYSSILKLNNDFFKELPFWMREALLRKVAQLVAWWQEGKMDKIELIKEFKKFAGLFAEINTIEKFYVKKKIK